jgi:hypothetical protein
MTNPFGIEEARIITISTAHLHPDTVEALDMKDHGGPLRRCDTAQSIAVREEGFLVNSHRGVPDALSQDLDGAMNDFPDLVLIRSLARGLKVDWINIDADGVEYTDVLPTYGHDGVARDVVQTPSEPGWAEALGQTGLNHRDNLIVTPSREALETIEAGQTPSLEEDGPEFG